MKIINYDITSKLINNDIMAGSPFKKVESDDIVAVIYPKMVVTTFQMWDHDEH